MNLTKIAEFKFFESVDGDLVRLKSVRNFFSNKFKLDGKNDKFDKKSADFLFGLKSEFDKISLKLSS